MELCCVTMVQARGIDLKQIFLISFITIEPTFSSSSRALFNKIGFITAVTHEEVLAGSFYFG